MIVTGIQLSSPHTTWLETEHEKAELESGIQNLRHTQLSNMQRLKETAYGKYAPNHRIEAENQ